MQKLKVNDEVVVLSGKDKGKVGKIKKINFKTLRVVIDGVNVFKKSLKPTQENPNGGFQDIEKPIHISNVNLYSTKLKKPSKVKIVVDGNKKVRKLAKCSSIIK